MWWSGIMRNNTCDDAVGEIRWQVIKGMLDEFSTLEEKVEDYLKEEQKMKKKRSTVLSVLSTLQ